MLSQANFDYLFLITAHITPNATTATSILLKFIQILPIFKFLYNFYLKNDNENNEK